MNDEENDWEKMWPKIKAFLIIVFSSILAVKFAAYPLDKIIIANDFPTLLSLLLALFSIWLSASFYRMAADASDRFSQKALELLLEIKVGHGQRLGTIEQRVEESLRGRLGQENEKSGENAEKKLGKVFERITPQTSPEELEQLKSSAIKQTKAIINDFYSMVEKAVPTIAEAAVETTSSNRPLENLEKLVDWLIENESKSEYITKKYLHQNVFGGDISIAKAIGYAVNGGILNETRFTPKNNPALRLPAVQLNGKHPYVKERIKKRGGS